MVKRERGLDHLFLSEQGKVRSGTGTRDLVGRIQSFRNMCLLEMTEKIVIKEGHRRKGGVCCLHDPTL